MVTKKNLIVASICFNSLILNSCIFGSGYATYVNDKIKPLMITATVVNKYEEQTGCFGAIVIKQYNSVDTLHNIFICAIEDEKVWSYLLPKDSIYKQAGSLVVEVVRNGKRVKFAFPTRD